MPKLSTGAVDRHIVEKRQEIVRATLAGHRLRAAWRASKDPGVRRRLTDALGIQLESRRNATRGLWSLLVKYRPGLAREIQDEVPEVSP